MKILKLLTISLTIIFVIATILLFGLACTNMINFIWVLLPVLLYIIYLSGLLLWCLLRISAIADQNHHR